MTEHKTEAREEWLAARIALLKAENGAPRGWKESGVWWRRHDEYGGAS